MDEIEAALEDFVVAFKFLTFNVSADWLEHYLPGSGQPLSAQLPWLRNNRSFNKAIESHRIKLEIALLEAVLGEVTGTLKGRQITRIGNSSEVSEPIDPDYLTDLYFASRRSSLLMRPQFQIWPKPGVPGIGGQANFEWRDTYDWDRQQYDEKVLRLNTLRSVKVGEAFITFKDIDDLRRCGRADSFDVSARWTAQAQPKQGMSNFVSWITQTQRPTYEVERRARQDI